MFKKKYLRPTERKLQKFIMDFKENMSKWRKTLYFDPSYLLRTYKVVGFKWGPEQHNLVPVMNTDAKILDKTKSSSAAY